VIHDARGYLMVDYSLTDVPMMTIDDWREKAEITAHALEREKGACEAFCPSWIEELVSSNLLRGGAIQNRRGKTICGVAICV
jgi:hypothetical protein